jgi:sugar-phosphatase
VRLALAACGLERYFAGVITADDAPAGKPAPAPYLACLCRFSIERRDAIAIEDAGAGIASAHAAGLRVIGVHNPAIARSADFYFDSLVTLRGAVEHRGENASLS